MNMNITVSKKSLGYKLATGQFGGLHHWEFYEDRVDSCRYTTAIISALLMAVVTVAAGAATLTYFLFSLWHFIFWCIAMFTANSWHGPVAAHAAFAMVILESATFATVYIGLGWFIGRWIPSFFKYSKHTASNNELIASFKGKFCKKIIIVD